MPYLSRTHALSTRSCLLDPAADVEDPDVGLVVDELEEVAVAGDDVDRLARIGRQRAR